MSDETTLSGVDLARVALQNARAAAKTAPQPARTRTARATSSRRGGRDPLTFGEAIARMVAERGWDTTTTAATKGNGIIDQWPTIAPELAGKVEAVRYDGQDRTLHLRPVTPAYRTQLNLHQKQIIAKVNEAAGPDAVRHLEILRPADLTARPSHEPLSAGSSRAPEPAAAPRPAAATVEPARRETPKGYREAIATHRATWTRQQHTNPKILAAAERQLRERLREPEERFADGHQALDELRAKAAAQQQVRPSDVSRARALQRLAAERAGLTTLTPTSALNPARPSQAA
ncbi:DciA family protein (plasmid) [Streptomyces sp. NBC_01102]|uniref:DciA family protein n=1 Tax=Streptomyces sp. NBC_01102 TaxID=2903749 RepID=UPI002F90950F|nr:DciA family protein [Streptomyces sp. NBC_01102]